MPQFVYPTPQVNPYAASISDLMLRQGDIAAQQQQQIAAIQANKATALGGIRAGEATAIGGDVAQGVQQVGQQFTPQAQSAQLDVESKKRAAAGTKALSDLLVKT